MSLRTPLSLAPLEDRTVPATIAVGNEGGTVRLVDPATGAVVREFRPLDAGGSKYTGLVNVALDDLTGDGKPDLVAAPASPLGDKGLAADKAGRLFVYDGAKLLDAAGTPTVSPLYARRPFGTGYTNGLNVAVGNVDGQGGNDIVVGSRGSSGGLGTAEPGRFVVLGAGEESSPTGGQIGTATAAFGTGYQKGCVIDTADLDGNGKAEVVVTRGGPVANGSDLKVKAFALAADGSFALVPNTEIVPFAGLTRGGKVAGVDTNGDGKDEFVVAALDASSNKVRVKTYDVRGFEVIRTYTVPPSNTRPPIAGDVVDFAVTAGKVVNNGTTQVVVALDNAARSDTIEYVNAGFTSENLDPFVLVPGGVSIDAF